MNNCKLCKYNKDNWCEQESNMTDEEFEDYYIYGVSCPYCSKKPISIMDVVCEYMSETFGGPCHTPNIKADCKLDCNYNIQGYEACWKRTFKKLKETKENG